MRDPTSANLERATQAPLLQSLGEGSFLGRAGGEGLGLIARDAALRGGALAGVLVVGNATEQAVDVLCACGTGLSTGRLSLAHRRFGLVGRVLESGHAADEPNLMERSSHRARAGARMPARQPGSRVWVRRGDVAAGAGRGVVTRGDIVVGADRGVVIAVDVVAGAGRGVVATGDVAVGAGRGVAGATG
jgi:hypothetical protein